jgi:hypothetical protein
MIYVEFVTCLFLHQMKSNYTGEEFQIHHFIKKKLKLLDIIYKDLDF